MYIYYTCVDSVPLHSTGDDFKLLFFTLSWRILMTCACSVIYIMFGITVLIYLFSSVVIIIIPVVFVNGYLLCNPSWGGEL